MAIYSNLKKVALFLIGGVLVFVLFYGGIITRQKEPEPKNVKTPPQVKKILPPEEKHVKIENYIKRGDTIINILKKQGVDHQAAYKFFTDVKPVYDLKRISAGKKYILFLSKDKGEIQRFRYEIDPDDYLYVYKDHIDDLYKGKLVAIPYLVEREFKSGKIAESLFAAILKSGEKAELVDMMASLYEFDIDFNRDIRKGDTYALAVEKMYLKGRFVRYGNLLAAEFTNRGKTTRVIHYTDPGGKTAYYHPDGRSVKKMFLRCPLPFMRVTSRYGSRRHPLLGFSGRHYGVDLAAPVGTKIRATAGGIVQKTGYNKTKGKFITVRHKNYYVSHYYHLSRFGKGIKSGKRVEQGQIIGYVGSTGLATGPHLHYGLQKNRRFINPLRLKSPAKDPVKKIYYDDFKQYVNGVFPPRGSLGEGSLYAEALLYRALTIYSHFFQGFLPGYFLVDTIGCFPVKNRSFN